MTASALNRAFFTIDILKNDVLYLFPKKSPDATDFSKAKFDAILDLSPHLAKMFSNVRNVGHKQAGSVNFYLRGMRSRTGLKSISVGLKVFDEYDEMPLASVALADERSSGYEEKDQQNIKISTPSVPEFGIAEEILRTTQEHYFFRCPRCSKFTELTYPECLVITTDNANDEVALRNSHLICRECKGILDHEAKQSFLAESNCEWVSTANPKAGTRGFQINQMYSTVLSPWKIAKTALLARTDSSQEQELYNSKLGLPHAVEGARVSDYQLAQCLGDHRQDQAPRRGLITMGVDVGHKVLYYNIDRWLLPPNYGPNLNTHAIPQTLKAGIVANFNDLDTLLRDYSINHTIVDVDPAFRDAMDFAERFNGHVNLCRFVRTVSPKAIQPSSESSLVLHVNRTYWLDVSQSRYRRGKKGIILPADISTDYRTHVKSLIRVEKKDDEGNLVAKYMTVGNRGDHSAFARVYSEVALPLAVSVLEGKDVKDLL